MTRRITYGLLFIMLIGMAAPGMAVDYGDIILTGGSQSGHFTDVYDLTAGDIVLSFTYNGTGMVDDAGAHAWSELGVRSDKPGAADFNPYWSGEICSYAYDAHVVTLYAAQDIPVGTVEISGDGTNITVTYNLIDGWCMTESHLAIETDTAAIPHTKTGNPVPGQFEYGETYDSCTTTDTFTVALADIPAGVGDTLFIAAHAAVKLVECETLIEAPYGASVVTSSIQGLRKDGTAVRPGRSNPDAVLTWNTSRTETDFYSLGFGGEIVVEYDCCIANRDGPDVIVVEDTWGAYPLETADVYASADGVAWVYLGEANNTVRDTTYNWQTVSMFDLGDLACARFIKVIDTTDPGPLPTDADGFDLNTIQALQDCMECATYYESAWGDGDRFVSRGNWATYITYIPTETCVPVEGSGVWLATDYHWGVNTFDPDPVGYPSLDLDDKLLLQKVGGQGEGAYNLPSSPPIPGNNHRFWWDRDGVDPWQNPATANTGGMYEVIITLHATSDTTGTAYMNIRGLDQGFETNGNWNTIELTPAGMTWAGDMKHLLVFYGIYGYGATHTAQFEDITVLQ